MAKFPLHKDPDAQWEAQRYEKPIPSRQYIKNVLEALGEPLSELELAQAFGIHKDLQQFESFQHRLRAMQRDGQLIQNRQGDLGLVAKMHLIQGVVLGHRDGYGFVRPDNGEADLYLSYRQMRAVFDGDRVLVREAGQDRRGRRMGSIVEVLERPTATLMGRYYVESGVGFVIPDNRRITHQVLIAPNNVNDAVPGQFVRVDILAPPHVNHQPVGKIVEILGDSQTAGIETDVALHTFGIPHEWPDAVLAESEAILPEVQEADATYRVDLRALPFVTIDGEDARDFDDAVYAEPTENGGFRLLVAIADVSHYVQRGSALDEEARLRGTSVYFPNRVVPMLPERLSNGLCSLKPHVDRLCMVCELRVSATGKVTRYQFFEGIMRSQARLTYSSVHQYLQTNATAWQSDLDAALEPEAVRNNVLALNALFALLLKERTKRGAIDFETTETRVVYDDGGRIDRIVARTRNDAHRLIEECMLLANVAAAKLLQKLEIPALYRIHEQPSEEKLDMLNQFLASLGLQFPKRKHLQPQDFQKIVERVQGRPDFSLIQTVLLRAMMQARYGSETQGHFGLAFPHYTHFTSPIRRYPDLVVHRAIRYVIRSRIETTLVKRVPKAKRLSKTAWLETSARQLTALGEQCSRAERRADEATRDAMDWLKCEYMQAHVGNVYEGVISAVTPFGFFVELKDIYVEGLVHVSTLNRDYYTHDAVHHRLIGGRTCQAHCLADAVTVRVSRVELDERKIDFELIDNAGLLDREARGIRFSAPARPDRGERKSRRSRSGKPSGKPSGKSSGKPSSKSSSKSSSTGKRSGESVAKGSGTKKSSSAKKGNTAKKSARHR
ncbi:MAG: ribonuclease R [Gammaproteobacteria bacterium]